jgi:hypothetical protein
LQQQFDGLQLSVSQVLVVGNIVSESSIGGWELGNNALEPELLPIDKGANKSSVIITYSLEWS